MIHEPRLFLLDEPLSNLDAALRVQMRLEIAEMQKRLGVPTVYVTHDQVEAMTLGHRIAVFSHGRMIQADTPEHLFKRPANVEVATFIGSPKMNILTGTLLNKGLTVSVRIVGTETGLSDLQAQACVGLVDRTVNVGLRPQDLHWIQEAPSRCTSRMRGRVLAVEPTGAETFVVVETDGHLVNSCFPSFAPVHPDDLVDLAFDPDDLYLFDPTDGRALLFADAGAAGPVTQGASNTITV